MKISNISSYAMTTKTTNFLGNLDLLIFGKGDLPYVICKLYHLDPMFLSSLLMVKENPLSIIGMIFFPSENQSPSSPFWQETSGKFAETALNAFKPLFETV